MSANKFALDIVKRFEGLSLAPYLCPAGVPTIGYGSTRYEDGQPVRVEDRPIIRERAEKLLSLVQSRIDNRIRSEFERLTPPEAGALGSFAYNLGVGALFGSTLARKIRAGDKEGAANEFGRWVFAGGVKLNGLIVRREAEKKLFEFG